MSEFPKDGSTFVVEAIDRTAYRWAKYKPDGSRQMGKPGRWQKQVVNGDWHRWENCEEPVGEISPPAEDGPISKAFKDAGHLEHWRQEVGKLHSQIDRRDAEITRLRAALAASREAHCGLAEYILDLKGPADTEGMFADLQKARLAADTALLENADAL